MDDYPESLFDDEELGLADAEFDSEMKELELSTPSAGNSQRGRPMIQESWTRVISLTVDDLDHPTIHPISTDLLMASSYPYLPRSHQDKTWAPLFYSKDFVAEHDNIRPENFELKSDKLKQIGVKVTKLR